MKRTPLQERVSAEYVDGSWYAARAYRKDAGGILWNAVNIHSGKECEGIPSYDECAIIRRASRMNRAALASVRA